MRVRELAEEFTELWDELEVRDINEMLAKNVGLDLLDFFVSYAEQFSQESDPEKESPKQLLARLPNLLVIGYMIRILEERVD